MSSCDPGGHCITCSDEGIAMQVLGIEEEALATCLDENGARHAVDVALVGTVGPGDSVLVHAGVALVRLESGALA